MNISDYDFGEDGRIKTPGKFEGEMLYLPKFWEESLDGLADTNRDGSIGLDVVSTDIEFFANEARFETGSRLLGLHRAVEALRRKRRIVFFERDDGFVTEK
jgi:hypothetical protein